MAKLFPEYKYLNTTAFQQEILDFWQSDNIFNKSISGREGARPFVFYEGPPSANGLPGIHHVMSRTLKDLVCRYKTMRGFQVKRKAGWDTHGLPVELGVEKELGITKEDIGVKISVEEYNQKCREAVMRYKAQWDDLTTRIGYWVDLEHPYITFENKYIETLWWCLKQLFDKGLLYKSVSIQPYSPAAGTGLSSHELNQPGTYKNVKDTTVVAMFRAAGFPEIFSAAGDLPVYFLAWTTTPWTLPSNLGLTVGPNIDYVLVETFNPYTTERVAVVLAEALVSKHFKAEGENGDFESYAAARSAPLSSAVSQPQVGGEGSGVRPVLPWRVLSRFKGRDLDGLRYEQLIPHEANSAEKSGGDPFRVVTGDFVTTEDGTGIVHTAPAFGADDYKVGKQNNLGIINLVDRQGKFVEGLGELSGRHVKDYTNDPDHKDVDVDIAVALKTSGHAFKVEKYEHSYPHCWRTDKPIVYYPLDAWFIRTTAAKERMVELNKTIHWKPAATGEGRFGNWLENMVDWNLSRSRYWGTPLPVWITENAENPETKCIGSVAELVREMQAADKALGLSQTAKFTGKETPAAEDLRALLDDKTQTHFDLHKPFVDEIVLADSAGRPMRREPDLIDVWFDSGAMPYAQWGLPAAEGLSEGGRIESVSARKMISWVELNEGKISPEEYQERIASKTGMQSGSLPFGEGWGGADFIAEGVDQTRGWFYTLHALGVLLFDSVAYKAVVSNGLVLDKNGQKMSKRLGNVVDPFKTIDQYGADATRWYLVTAASPWDNLKFDIDGIGEAQRKFFGTLFNTYQFFALYANVDGFSGNETPVPYADRPESDRWILSALHTLIGKVTAAYDDYEPTLAGRLIEEFLDENLSNWYVRLNRRRFWKGEYNADKISAFQTLVECLRTLSQLIAPIAPFFADWLWRSLRGDKGEMVESVHLSDFPESNPAFIDTELEARTHIAQELSSLLLSIRKKANIKVRQPLQKALIPVLDAKMRRQIEAIEELVRAEVNVKDFEYLEEGNDIIQKKVKPNFKALGGRLGANMKAAAALLTALPTAEINRFEAEGKYELSLPDGTTATIFPEDVSILAEDVPGWSIASKGVLTAALDVTLTPQLLAEGAARELINRVQKMRKDQALALTDRILLEVEESDVLRNALADFTSYIKEEVLADRLDVIAAPQRGEDVEVADATVKVFISKTTA